MVYNQITGRYAKILLLVLVSFFWGLLSLLFAGTAYGGPVYGRARSNAGLTVFFDRLSHQHAPFGQPVDIFSARWNVPGSTGSILKKVDLPKTVPQPAVTPVPSVPVVPPVVKKAAGSVMPEILEKKVNEVIGGMHYLGFIKKSGALLLFISFDKEIFFMEEGDILKNRVFIKNADENEITVQDIETKEEYQFKLAGG